MRSILDQYLQEKFVEESEEILYSSGRVSQSSHFISLLLDNFVHGYGG